MDADRVQDWREWVEEVKHPAPPAKGWEVWCIGRIGHAVYFNELFVKRFDKHPTSRENKKAAEDWVKEQQEAEA